MGEFVLSLYASTKIYIINPVLHRYYAQNKTKLKKKKEQLKLSKVGLEKKY